MQTTSRAKAKRGPNKSIRRPEQKKSQDPEKEIGGKNMNIVATPKKRG